MKLDRLILLLHHRWLLPALVELHRTDGAKFVTLARRLGASRDALRPTVDALLAQGLARRNPGYGHPMRPEYVLTKRGADLAPAADRLLRALRAARLERVALRKWSLPVAAALGAGRSRFKELKESLPGVTSRALALALSALEESGLVRRRVLDAHPPATRYELTPRGAKLHPLVDGVHALA